MAQSYIGMTKAEAEKRMVKAKYPTAVMFRSDADKRILSVTESKTARMTLLMYNNKNIIFAEGYIFLIDDTYQKDKFEKVVETFYKPTLTTGRYESATLHALMIMDQPSNKIIIMFVSKSIDDNGTFKDVLKPQQSNFNKTNFEFNKEKFKKTSLSW